MGSFGKFIFAIYIALLKKLLFLIGSIHPQRTGHGRAQSNFFSLPTTAIQTFGLHGGGTRLSGNGLEVINPVTIGDFTSKLPDDPTVGRVGDLL